ncbi:MAG TPA: hypothetical protein VG840_09680, partial [Casimicrobiaceae bacterium]|nr:hypothetical protein [Casimicrobiaceae bacterium]
MIVDGGERVAQLRAVEHAQDGERRERLLPLHGVALPSVPEAIARAHTTTDGECMRRYRTATCRLHFGDAQNAGSACDGDPGGRHADDRPRFGFPMTFHGKRTPDLDRLAVPRRGRARLRCERA